MGGSARAVLRPGDWVSFDGGEHQVLAVAGTSVRLRAQAGSEQVVLASYLMAVPDFAVVGGEPAPQVEPFGLLDSLPEEGSRGGAGLGTARGGGADRVCPPDVEPGTTPRPGFDPAARTVVQRTEAKATELGVGYRTVERMRARYAQQGLCGLVDRRAVRVTESTGRADARLVAVARQVIDAETHSSTGYRRRNDAPSERSLSAAQPPAHRSTSGDTANAPATTASNRQGTRLRHRAPWP
jgi:hypothetical protein